MNIPAQQVTLEFLKEKLENAFFNIINQTDDFIIVDMGTNVAITVPRHNLVRIQSIYTLTEYSPTNFQKALEQSNKANDTFLGIQSHVYKNENNINVFLSFYMFFGETFDLKLFVSNLNFVNRVSTQIMQDIFYA